MTLTPFDTPFKKKKTIGDNNKGFFFNKKQFLILMDVAVLYGR